MNKLKEYRNFSRLTQEELSKESGISIRTIQRIEKGLTTGSSHTIKTLAATLHIESENLIVADINQNEAVADELDKVKLMNFSILSMIFIPFGNLILPTIIFLHNRKLNQVNTLGRKIISLQILNTLAMLFLGIILYVIIGRGSELIPLPVSLCYVLYALISSIIVIYTAMVMKDQKDALKFVPSLI